jgi:catechol 2,3-dioxygenase-like lactoylglutathione lyase family enzyme
MQEVTMQRVTGIGGVFLKARDPEALRAWYRDHLGFEVQDWGGVTFHWHSPEKPALDGATVWSVFPESSEYFAPSAAPFMINYRVQDLHAVLAALRDEGCAVDEKVEESEFGRFGWVLDPEGNKVELWEPPPGQLP